MSNHCDSISCSVIDTPIEFHDAWHDSILGTLFLTEMASTFLSKHIVESSPEDWPSNRETALTGTIDSSVSQVPSYCCPRHVQLYETNSRTRCPLLREVIFQRATDRTPATGLSMPVKRCFPEKTIRRFDGSLPV